MKNIIILGPSRVGKSTLSSLLCKKYNFNYISGDSIRNAFINIYPQLGYTAQNTIKRVEFCKFINFIINENSIHLKRALYYVVDSAEISIKNAKKYFKNSLIICLGCKDITIEDMIQKIKTNDTKLDWTYKYDDRSLKEIAKNTIDESRRMSEECKINNVSYFDTSLDRIKTYNEILKFLERQINNHTS